MDAGKNTQLGMHHRGTVYSLGWGPRSEAGPTLFSCGSEGTLLAHGVPGSDEDAFDMGAQVPPPLLSLTHH